MSIQSRINAGSLARDSTERAQSLTRCSLKTPASSRLHPKTNPPRSHLRIFNLPLRLGRRTNDASLRGLCPMTAITRYAKHSNPQSMSVASTAIQILVPRVRSSVRKLGCPIMLPAPKATREDDACRIQALPPGCGSGSAPPQSLHCASPAPPAC